MGAASQFFCLDPDGGLSSQDGDAYTECVYRDDTLVLLELTTRDMMEVPVLAFVMSIASLHLHVMGSYIKGSGVLALLGPPPLAPFLLSVCSVAAALPVVPSRHVLLDSHVSCHVHVKDDLLVDVLGRMWGYGGGSGAGNCDMLDVHMLGACGGFSSWVRVADVMACAPSSLA